MASFSMLKRHPILYLELTSHDDTSESFQKAVISPDLFTYNLKLDLQMLTTTSVSFNLVESKLGMFDISLSKPQWNCNPLHVAKLFH